MTGPRHSNARSGKAVHLRPCVETDAEALYVLRNNPELIALSTRKITVTWNEHLAWLRACLAAPQEHRIFLLETEKTETIGMIRFDRDNEVTARISIMLTPSYVDKGIGTTSLMELTRKIHVLWPTLRAVNADVLDGNERAVRAFEKAGFKAQKADALPGHYLLRFPYMHPADAECGATDMEGPSA